ncbi:PREDICTED: uncharacterized protein LOC108762762 isoform X2 [Trachymyrmex cornetzi]|nr:PREDICTED: uncharacterized protein LOC108762762 isoform X2 [Trachymyrmex cornetzi]XP_018365422.1 PREDICTED: uncharacterized protein LOC108762762 isoform X2 [Trachymyrmex cornetzi]XP_018365423.1 PREDICTED: uncharacterized protein LOC108762762 isoform X2 [Trachymyrmex cornetzi]
MTSVSSTPKPRRSLRSEDTNNIHSPPITSISSKLKSRRSPRSEDTSKHYSLNNNFQSLEMERIISRQQNISNSSETEELFKNQSYENIQVTESSSEEDEETLSLHRSQNRSRTTSLERNVRSQKIKYERDTKKNEQNTSSNLYLCIFILGLVVGIIFFKLPLNNKGQSIILNNPLLLTESVQNLKASFYNQELDIWSDISCAINEVKSGTPKIPSVILLFAKETTTMNCLATKLAHISSDILNADNYLIFNPKDFGNDAGEIITTLNEHSPEKKKVVIIHDILNINTEAIKALHNLCDRINPLVAEAIYILTMQTNSSLSQQKKLNFVENQIYNRLSKSIDQDVLLALITRITDGVIISVQPEPQLRYC